MVTGITSMRQARRVAKRAFDAPAPWVGGKSVCIVKTVETSTLVY